MVIEGAGKSYPHRAGAVRVLRDITITVSDGEFVAIVGPSGCGKSTLLAMVGGLTDVTEGRVYFRGNVSIPPRIGVVFQEHALFPWRTVERNVAFGLESLGVKRRERLLRAREWISRVGLQGFEHRYPHQLSGGMRQRAGIARALAVQPHLLLMDEPLSALDAQSRLLMQDELIRLWEAYPHTTLYVTHNIDEAVSLADRVVILSSRPGRIAEILTIEVPRAQRRTPEQRLAMIDYTEHIWMLIRDDAERAFMEP